MTLFLPSAPLSFPLCQAPTQHISEYSAVIVVGAGIGATPVSSTLKSIVFHKWRVNVGECFPAHAYFTWVCAHRDIDAFRWLIRTIREAQDEVVHQRQHNAASMAGKTFEFHIFLTSAPKNPKPIEVVIDDEVGFWGPPREANRIDKVRGNWDEVALYKAMKVRRRGDTAWNGRSQAVDGLLSRCHFADRFLFPLLPPKVSRRSHATRRRAHLGGPAQVERPLQGRRGQA